VARPLEKPPQVWPQNDISVIILLFITGLCPIKGAYYG